MDRTVQLLHRCGYWYFLHRVQTPESWKAGTRTTVAISWENRGVAPAYEPFQLHLRLCGPETVDLRLESGNRRWFPSPEGKTYEELYPVELPRGLKSGEYTLGLKLYSAAADRDVLLALKRVLLDENGFYTIGKVRVE